MMISACCLDVRPTFLLVWRDSRGGEGDVPACNPPERDRLRESLSSRVPSVQQNQANIPGLTWPDQHRSMPGDSQTSGRGGGKRSPGLTYAVARGPSRGIPEAGRVANTHAESRSRHTECDGLQAMVSDERGGAGMRRRNAMKGG